MEILDRLKSIVGVGAPTIALSEPGGPLRPGQLLRGGVTLQGGDYDTPVKDVQVRLEEERVVYLAQAKPERQFWRHIAEVTIFVDGALDGRVLKQSERLELSFELVVPVDLAPTGGSVGYALVAETEVPGLNPRAELIVTVEAE